MSLLVLTETIGASLCDLLISEDIRMSFAPILLGALLLGVHLALLVICPPFVCGLHGAAGRYVR